MRRVVRVSALLAVVLTAAIAYAGTAAAATWTSAAQVSGATTTSDDHASVVDRFGTTTVAWQQRSGSLNVIMVARSGAAGWSTPVQMSTAADINATRPRLAVAPSGDVWLVWQETSSSDTSTHRYVRTRTFSRSAGWGPIRTAADGTGGTEPTPAIAVGADGVAYIAYAKIASGVVSPVVVTSTDAGWSAGTTVTGTSVSSLRLLVPTSGRPVVLWLQGSVVAAASWTGAAWTATTTTSGGLGSPSGLTVAATDDRVTAVWTSMDISFGFPPTTTMTVSTNRYTLASGWQTSQAVGSGISANRGTVATTPNGDDVFAWLDAATASANVKMRTRLADGTWQTAQQVSAVGATGNNVPTASVDATGALLIAWVKGASQPYTPIVARLVDGTWTRTSYATGYQVFAPTLATGGSTTSPVTSFSWRADPAASDPRGVFASTLVTLPDAPTNVTLGTPAGQTVDVSFDPASDGGTAITTFRVTCTSADGGVTRTQSGSASPITVDGLAIDASYTCTVAAQNAEGWSAESAASSPAVRISAPAPAPDATGGQTTTAPAPTTGASAPTTPTRTVALRFASAPGASYGTSSGGGTAPTALQTQVVAPGPGTIRQIATSGGRSLRAATRRAVVCAATIRVTKAGKVTVTCPLTPATRRTLRLHAVTARVVVTFTGTDGTLGRSVRTVVIPRAPVRGPAVAVTG